MCSILPFVPGRAFWITRGLDGKTHRHEISPKPSSILRGYAAAWGPFVTVGTPLTIGSVVHVSPRAVRDPPRRDGGNALGLDGPATPPRSRSAT
jgi:hypothetical protein